MDDGVLGRVVEYSDGSRLGSCSKTGHYSRGHDRAAGGRDAHQHRTAGKLGNDEREIYHHDPAHRRPTHYGGVVSHSRPFGA
ncbi:hypothetical protein PG996_001263 [Apiospora saccharicola]|uniref:Uncharacterized protein n=1 Tax=Apiospora saccharicola TaxID=335842 RepID=A0ABR1WG95_9PEZI